jgi:alpha-beta hydrolase superfamily lysophospholipase
MKRRLAFWTLLPIALLAALVGGLTLYTVATAADEAPFQHTIGTSSRDVSPAFAPFRNADGLEPPAIEAAFADVSERLRSYRIVVVPGYLTDGFLLTNRIGITDYFGSQIAALQAEGFDVTRAPVDTEAPVADNAAVLARLVAASDRPVCFVSHSKGGLDVLAFLVAADAATRARIACWVALQSPFHGTPIADMAAGSKPLRAIADPLARELGGAGGSLDDLTVALRAAWMADHDTAVRAVVAGIPTLAVATFVGADDAVTPNLYMQPAWNWMRTRDLPNDGLVPVASAVLPGARYIILSGLDHTDTIANSAVFDRPLDRLLFLKAVLAQTLAEE